MRYRVLEQRRGKMTGIGNFFNNSVAAKDKNIQAKQAAPKTNLIFLSFWGGEFTYEDRAEGTTTTSKMNRDDYKAHFWALVNKAEKNAREQKKELYCTDAGRTFKHEDYS